MPIRAWFPTYVYCEPLQPRGLARCNGEILQECYQVRDYDEEGRAWSAEHYLGGYTSYGSLSQLHRVSSTFESLERKIRSHVRKFAQHLEFDLRGRTFAMTDCWVNIMPARTAHGLHLHPLSFISGTYYAQTPPGCSGIKFEDPRLASFMAAPPRRADPRDDSRAHVTYPAEAGNVILFESWLRHEVPANPIDQDRVSISFNYAWQ